MDRLRKAHDVEQDVERVNGGHVSVTVYVRRRVAFRLLAD